MTAIYFPNSSKNYDEKTVLHECCIMPWMIRGISLVHSTTDINKDPFQIDGKIVPIICIGLRSDDDEGIKTVSCNVALDIASLLPGIEFRAKMGALLAKLDAFFQIQPAPDRRVSTRFHWPQQGLLISKMVISDSNLMQHCLREKYFELDLDLNPPERWRQLIMVEPWLGDYLPPSISSYTEARKAWYEEIRTLRGRRTLVMNNPNYLSIIPRWQLQQHTLLDILDALFPKELTDIITAYFPL